MKKILLFTRGLGIGGAQKNLLFLANTLALNEFDVHLVSITNQKVTMDIDDKIDLIFLNYDWTDFKKMRFLNRRLLELKIILSMRKAIREINPDLVIAFVEDIINYTFMAKKFLKCKTIVSERDNPYIFSKRQKNRSARNYKRANHIVFQTQKARDFYKSISDSKVSIIPNPAFSRQGTSVVYKGIRLKKFVSAGRFERIKGFDDLIRAFRIFVDKHKDFKLHIYGEGSEENNLNNLIQSLNLNDSVVLLKSKNNIFTDEKDAYGFILPSHSEGIPNVIIESMLVGLPVIASDCEPGGPRILLSNGDRGLLFEVGNFVELSEKMEELWLNKELHEKFINKSHEVLIEYNPELIKDMWLRTVRKVLGN